MKYIIIIFYLFLFTGQIAFSQVHLSPALRTACENKWNSDEKIGFIIYLNEQVDNEALTEQLSKTSVVHGERATYIIAEHMNLAFKTQKNLLQYLYKHADDYPDHITTIKPYWIRNAVYVEAIPSLVSELVKRDDIHCIDLNYGKFSVIEPIGRGENAPKNLTGPEPGLIAINAPALWAMGYTGRNTVLLSMDTGVWTDHPALSEAFLGNYFPLSQVWFGVRSAIPADNASSCHGTHTTGTVLGLDPATTDTIGVAYNASFIATDPVASSNSDLLAPTDFMDVFQWVLDPDGNPETTYDIPDVINNSWGYDYTLAIPMGACEMEEAHVLETIEAAGICSPFSAGNEGPAASTNGFPAMLAYNLVNCMSIGAVNGNNENYPIADFSSRGPTPCVSEEGPLQIKPEVVAPGYNVRSASGHDTYEALSGTSMACPHVSGALLLLREAFPEASAYELKYALYVTAHDLGEPNEDNTYGMGMIDVLDAFNYLSGFYTPAPPVTNQVDITCELITPDVKVFCLDEAHFTPQMHIVNNGTSAVSDLVLKATCNDVVFFDAIPNLLLLPGQDATIDLNEIHGMPGRNEIAVSATHSTEVDEYNVFDNYDVASFNVIGEYDASYIQCFDTLNGYLVNADWFIDNPDSENSWNVTTWNDATSNRALFIDFYNYLPREGQLDDAWSPRVHVPDTGSTSLSFVYAYKKRMETLFKDSLIVLVSTDCDGNFNSELWRIGGVDMATVSGNAGNNGFTPQTEADWDTVTIGLNQFKNNDIVVCLRTRNDDGGTLYIDDFKIEVQSTSGIESPIQSKPYLAVYPNPATECLFIASNSDLHSSTITIYDTGGRLVFEIPAGTLAGAELGIGFLQPGMYFIQLDDGESLLQKRFVKLKQ